MKNKWFNDKQKHLKWHYSTGQCLHPPPLPLQKILYVTEQYIMSCNTYVHVYSVCMCVQRPFFSLSLCMHVYLCCHSFSSYRIDLQCWWSHCLSGWRIWIMLVMVVSLGNIRKRATDTCWVCWYYNTSNVMHCVVQWLVMHVHGLSTILGFV